MLFNSYIFLAGFLPLTLAVCLGLARLHLKRAEIAALVVASIIFYMWWHPPDIGVLLTSIAANYALGRLIGPGRMPSRLRLVLLVAGISGNLAALAYFKYTGFFLASLAAALHIDMAIPHIVMPLGISFYTFTQIAYLVDIYLGETEERDPLVYALFVTFFPHLIAGPIIHHREMMPQFTALGGRQAVARNLVVGGTIFTIGLFKKVVLADWIATFSSPMFDAAAVGQDPTLTEAWWGCLAFSLQLYFDFSGYSDMAIGLSRLFGIRMPINFNSPYKANSIIDFWRRWHMTLTRLVTAYLYTPLTVRLARLCAYKRWSGYTTFWIATIAPVVVTFLAVGVWHGAGWNFFLFGLLHGGYMTINHLWRRANSKSRYSRRVPTTLYAAACRALTYAAVVVSLVLFRAADFAAARRVFAGLAGSNATAPGAEPTFFGSPQVLAVLALLFIAMVLPNTQEIMARFRPAIGFDGRAYGRHLWQWRPRPLYAVPLAIAFGLAVTMISGVSEFLYFQF